MVPAEAPPHASTSIAQVRRRLLTVGKRVGEEVGFLFPQGYCDEFQRSLPPAIATWESVLTHPAYGASFMHVACIEKLAYRPLPAPVRSWVWLGK